MKLSFGLLAVGSYPPAEFVALVKRAEAARFDHLWTADERFYRDCWAELAVATQHSREIYLGTAVTDPYVRHPALTAVSIATIQELSQGRAILGLGIGGSGFQQMGIKPERPLTVLRETIELIRALLRGDQVDFRGQTVSFKGRLNTPPAPTLPIMVATNGAQIMELAGEIADIVMVQGMASPAMVGAVLEHVDAGARKANRPRPKLVARVDTCISDDPNVVRMATLPGLTRHLRVHHPEFKSQALAGLRVSDELKSAIGNLTYAFDIAGAEKVGSLVTDDFIDRLCLVGTASDVESRIRDLVRAGVDQIALFPVSAPDQPSLQANTIDAFARLVIPQFEA